MCPWIDNACDEKLALFPPTPPLALLDSHKERSSALLQLTALPNVSSSATDYMKSRSPNVEGFLLESSCPPITLKNGIRLTDNPKSMDLVDGPVDSTANMYYQVRSINVNWSYCLSSIHPLLYVVRLGCYSINVNWSYSFIKCTSLILCIKVGILRIDGHNISCFGRDLLAMFSFSPAYVSVGNCWINRHDEKQKNKVEIIWYSNFNTNSVLQMGFNFWLRWRMKGSL